MKGMLVALLVASMVTGCSSAPDEPVRLMIATGGAGGVYEALGRGLAQAAHEHLGAKADVLVTAAPAENLRLVADGYADVGFTLADSAMLATTGSSPFNQPLPIAALARLYDNYLHLVVRDGVRVVGVADLAGKAVSTGAVRSGTELVAERLLELAGLDPDDVTLHRLGVAESAAALADGRIDAFFWSGGLPTRAIADLASTARIHLVDLARYANDLGDRYGQFYTERSIPASTYGLGQEVATIGVPNFLVVSEAMNDGVAHQVTRLLFDAKDDLVAAHPEARRINQRAAIDTHPVPLHPGAARYYRQSKVLSSAVCPGRWPWVMVMGELPGGWPARRWRRPAAARGP